MTRVMPQKNCLNRKTQRLLTGDYRFNLLEHVRQRRRIHNLRSRVANFLHHDPDSATALVAALAAPHVRRLADARQRRDWPVQHAYNVPDADKVRLAAEEISATLALLALQQPLVLQLEQYQLKELARDALALRHIRN